ncbi:MAG: PD-(D/E)XK nuclease superfamily protein [Bdellovibrionales bacterium]
MRFYILIICAFLFCFSTTPALADSQGSQANASGQKLETDVSTLLATKGFHVEKHSGYGGKVTELTMKGKYPRLALRQPPYTTLYGSPGRCDFVLIAKELPEDVWIETKRMSLAGSIDEKLPHTFLNSLAANPGRHVIIVIDGDGWRPGALEWIRAATKDRRWAEFANYPGKRVDVMTPAEFKIWLDNTFDKAD